MEPEHLIAALERLDLAANPETEGEYWAMAAAVAKAKPDLIPQSLFDHIDEGPPDAEDYRAWISSNERFKGENLEREVESYRATWQRDRMAALRPALNSDRAKELGKLVDVHGSPERIGKPDFTHTSGGFVPFDSPLTREEVAGMTSEELIDYLLGLGEIDEFALEGLSRFVEEEVKKNPQPFVDRLPQLAEVKHDVVRPVLRAIRGLNESSLSDWVPVAQVVADIAEQVMGKDARDGAEFSAQLLLGDIMESQTPSPELRAPVWRAIECFAQHVDPKLEAESGRFYGGDYYTHGINSVRGVAMRDAIRYAWWLTKDGLERPIGASMPEVVAVLDAHVSREKDPSKAVAAMFGPIAVDMFYLDEKWVRDNIDLIFSSDDLASDPAWQAYIRYVHPFKKWLEFVVDREERFAKEIGRGDDVDSQLRRRCIERAVDFSAYGVFSFDSGPLATLLESADSGIRTEIMRHAAHCSKSATGERGGEARARLRDFLDSRLALLESHPDNALLRAELAEFGTWLSVSQLESEWLVARAVRIVEITRSLEDHLLVTKALVELAPAHPGEVAAIVGILSDGLPSRVWYGHRSDLQAILRLLAANEGTANIAKAIRSRFVVEGILGPWD